MKKVISAVLSLALCLSLCAPAFAAGTFTDVGGWAEPYIERAASLGLVSGVGGGRFSPDSKVSYLQYAIMLCAVKYKDETAKAIEENSGEWWRPYCVVAGRHGLFDDTVMAGEQAWNSQNGQPVPRQAMAQMMYNYLRAEGKQLPSDGEKAAARAEIADIASVDARHTDAVLTCWSMGLLSGTGSGFSPASTMDRAQAATVLCALYDAVMNGADAQPEETAQPEQTTQPEETAQLEQTTQPEQSKALLANGKEITEENVLAIINGLRSSYPEGMRWTNDNSYTSNALFVRGYGCAAFALICSDAAFGDLPQTRQHSNFDDIRVGDMLRVLNDTHSVVVLEKRANSVIVTEGNFNSSIHWDREITRREMENQNFYVRTRYPG